tara:strand:+ start:17148 stop:17300 length:153 start_codon:yes stop_codon:yes gene_type:complete
MNLRPIHITKEKEEIYSELDLKIAKLWNEKIKGVEENERRRTKEIVGEKI